MFITPLVKFGEGEVWRGNAALLSVDEGPIASPASQSLVKRRRTRTIIIFDPAHNDIGIFFDDDA